MTTSIRDQVEATIAAFLGTDPYSEGLLPQTIGEVVEFYDRDRQPQV